MGKKIVIILASLFLACAVFIWGTYYYFCVKFSAPGPLSQAQIIKVKKRASVKKIAALLEDTGCVRSKTIFFYGTMLFQEKRSLKAGVYKIPAHATMQYILEMLASGRVLVCDLTLPEGLTVEQAFLQIASADYLSGALPSPLPQEGSLLADTIKCTYGQTRCSVVAQLIKAQQKLVEKIWQQRDETIPLKNSKELLIVASLIQRESAKEEEYPLIAGVFYNRLQKNMRLQSDPTVLYGIFGGAGKPSGRHIYRSDLQQQNPYNTYVIKGLPPSAIANPGKAALWAAAHPKKTKALYFVADGQGGHIFSDTLEEHQQNVKEWRKIKEERKAEKQ